MGGGDEKRGVLLLLPRALATCCLGSAYLDRIRETLGQNLEETATVEV